MHLKRCSFRTEWRLPTHCVKIAARAFGRVEASYTLPHAIEIGGGVRISDEVRPYGLVGVPIGGNFALRGMGGPDYVAVGVRAKFLQKSATPRENRLGYAGRNHCSRRRLSRSYVIGIGGLPSSCKERYS